MIDQAGIVGAGVAGPILQAVPILTVAAIMLLGVPALKLALAARDIVFINHKKKDVYLNLLLAFEADRRNALSPEQLAAQIVAAGILAAAAAADRLRVEDELAAAALLVENARLASLVDLENARAARAAAITAAEVERLRLEKEAADLAAAQRAIDGVHFNLAERFTNRAALAYSEEMGMVLAEETLGSGGFSISFTCFKRVGSFCGQLSFGCDQTKTRSGFLAGFGLDFGSNKISVYGRSGDKNGN